jgi:hypothetical protein
MNTITVTYALVWQISFAPEYKFSKCKKCFNCKRNSQLKQVMQGGSIGYNIRSKFYTLNYLKSKLERIPVINNFPF